MSQPESRYGGDAEAPSEKMRYSRGLLRVCLGLVGLTALAWGALWTYAGLEAFSPDFNLNSAPSGEELRLVTILGCLGVLASFATGGSGLAYARTAAPRWLAGVAVGAICTVPLFVVWIDVWELAGGCS